MYVIAQHRVVDPEAFFADIPAVAAKAPPGVHPRMFCPSADRATAVCLWQADSIEAVRDYLDDVSAGASENSYFEVGAEHALGLPEVARAGER
ncbi:MAG TPA: hypothetical protein VFZ68_16845 [Acidimicrobiales bacterium]